MGAGVAVVVVLVVALMAFPGVPGVVVVVPRLLASAVTLGGVAPPAAASLTHTPDLLLPPVLAHRPDRGRNVERWELCLRGWFAVHGSTKPG